MHHEERTEEQLEDRLRAHFEAEAGREAAPSDVWEQIQDRLPDQLQPMMGEGRVARLSRLVTSPVAAAAALVLLIGGLGVFLATAVGGPESLLVGGGNPTPTPARGSVFLRGSLVQHGQSLSEPQGPAGPAGAPGAPEWNVISDPGLSVVPVPTAARPAQPTPAPSARQFLRIGSDGAVEDRGSTTVTISGGGGGERPAIDLADRQIISTASVGVEVEQIRPALSQLRTIAESLGGFVESLSSSGGPEPKSGTATVRVPRPAFFDALDRIKGLGSVLNEQVGTEDVTDKVIDLQARLRSEQRKETSFLSLLERTSTVSDVLNVERELARVRAEIERIEGQLAFIERRVDLGTINVSLSVPGAPIKQTVVPPSGNVQLDVDNLDDAVSKIRAMGTVSQAILTVNGGFERSSMVLEVPMAEFDGAIKRIEALGKVVFKEIRQPGGLDSPVEGEAKGEQPKARIDLVLTQPPTVERSTNYWLWVGAPVGGAAALFLLAYVAFRLGRRRVGTID